MEAEYRQHIGIAADANLVQTNSEWKQKKGRDTDYEYYEERDAEGNVVAKYEIQDSTSMYPPFGRTVHYFKYAPDGTQIATGSIPTR